MNRTKAWIQASRLPSQSYIFLPLLLGQGYAVMDAGTVWNWPVFLWATLLSLTLQLFIVYGNDYQDVETDRINRTFTMFSGGSRVLVEELLSRRALAAGTLLMAALSLLTGAVFVLGYDRPLALPIILAGMALLYLYSFPPFRFNYRGGGELLQTAGTAVVLPVLGYYLQSGISLPAQWPWALAGTLIPLQLACAISTALPDYPSDTCSSKKTMVVLLGPLRAKIFIVILNALSLLLVATGVWIRELPDAMPFLLAGPAAANLALITLIRRSDAGSRRLAAFVAINVIAITLLLHLVMLLHVF